MKDLKKLGIFQKKIKQNKNYEIQNSNRRRHYKDMGIF
jgi:hypothetical protein